MIITPPYFARMTSNAWPAVMLGLMLLIATQTFAAKNDHHNQDQNNDGWTTHFQVDKAELSHTGTNPYFILVPGQHWIYEDNNERLIITVLDETKMVDGVETRVVEERETENGKLIEISRNFFAISTRTNSVYYFGEEVEIYRNGRIVHDGSWLAGENNARFGMIMSGDPLIGSRYYQEIAPGVAMDRAEVLSVTQAVRTPAGHFPQCLGTEESSPLENGKSYKIYAPGIGLVVDNNLKLIRHGRSGKPST